MENWKPVAGYEGLYEVSDMGRVRSLVTNRVLKPGYNNCGYIQVLLCKSGHRKNALIHRLVANAFVPNPDMKPCVNHLDENKKNNVASNLEWCTYKENSNWGTCIERTAKRLSKQVEQYDRDGHLVAIFPSTREAERQTGIASGSIRECCVGGRYKSAGGYVWRYS